MSSSHSPDFRAHLLLPRFWPTWTVVLPGALLAFVPARVRAWLGDAAASVAVRVDSKRRRMVLRNLALCYPQLDERQRRDLLRRHTRVVMQAFLGFGQLLLRSPRHLQRQFDIEGLEIVEREVAAGRGIILLTPHSLALEYAGQCLSIDHPMLTIVRVHHKNDLLDWLVTKFRDRYAKGGIFGQDASMRAVVRAVRSGKWLYYLPDDDRAIDVNVFAPFYGVQKSSVPTLGRLAQSCGASVIPLMTAWSPERLRFRVKFFPPLDTLTGDDMLHDATEVNRAIERIVDEDPAQYMWSAKIFRERPAGEPDLYRDI